MYVGEIRMFAGNFPPNGWRFCDGSLLSIAENEVLFVLIGTTYGGDGESTFALPDFRGRVPIHNGNGHILGELGGTESVTLTTAQLPSHTHLLGASASAPAAAPCRRRWGSRSARGSRSTPRRPRGCASKTAHRGRRKSAV